LEQARERRVVSGVRPARRQRPGLVKQRQCPGVVTPPAGDPRLLVQGRSLRRDLFTTGDLPAHPAGDPPQILRGQVPPGSVGEHDAFDHEPLRSRVTRLGSRWRRWRALPRQNTAAGKVARFEGSPRVLGIAGDREVLTFMDGEVAADPRWQPGHGHRLPPYARTELALRGAGQLIRKLHQAAAGFRPTITSYRFDPRPPRPGEIVSHGDLGPWNTVYRHGIPVAFIDWDAARPVDPLADLASAARTFVPLASLGQLCEAGFDPLPDLPARRRMFLDAYGLPDRKAILPALRRCTLDEPEPLRWLQDMSPDLARAL